MKALTKGLFVYGMLSSLVAWIGLLFVTLINLVLAFSSMVPGGVIWQYLVAAVILLLLALLLFWLLKALMGAGISLLAAAKGGIATVAKAGLPKGFSMAKSLANGVARLDPRSLRTAGNIARGLGRNKTGKFFNQAAYLSSGMKELKDLHELDNKKNDGKVRNGKKKDGGDGAAKALPGNTKEQRDKDKREFLKRDRSLFDQVFKSSKEERFKFLKEFVTDSDGNKLTGEELKQGIKDRDDYKKRLEDVDAFKDAVPSIAKNLTPTQMSDFLGDRMDARTVAALGLDDERAQEAKKNIMSGFDKGGSLEDKKSSDDERSHEEPRSKRVEAAGGNPQEHEDPNSLDPEEKQKRDQETKTNDEKSSDINNDIKDNHQSVVDAMSGTPGAEGLDNARSVSTTKVENNNATLNSSASDNGTEAVISSDEKERKIAAGIHPLSVDKEVADDYINSSGMSMRDLENTLPGTPEGTAMLDENGEPIRNHMIERDENGNAISSVMSDEIQRSAEISGNSIYGTTVPKSVTDRGEFSEESIAAAASAESQQYRSGMKDQDVASVSGVDSVDTVSGNNVDSYLSSDHTPSAGITSDDINSAINEGNRETVEASSASKQEAQQRSFSGDLPGSASRDATPEPAATTSGFASGMMNSDQESFTQGESTFGGETTTSGVSSPAAEYGSGSTSTENQGYANTENYGVGGTTPVAEPQQQQADTKQYAAAGSQRESNLGAPQAESHRSSDAGMNTNQQFGVGDNGLVGQQQSQIFDTGTENIDSQQIMNDSLQNFQTSSTPAEQTTIHQPATPMPGDSQGQSYPGASSPQQPRNTQDVSGVSATQSVPQSIDSPVAPTGEAFGANGQQNNVDQFMGTNNPPTENFTNDNIQSAIADREAVPRQSSQPAPSTAAPAGMSQSDQNPQGYSPEGGSGSPSAPRQDYGSPAPDSRVPFANNDPVSPAGTSDPAPFQQAPAPQQQTPAPQQQNASPQQQAPAAPSSDAFMGSSDPQGGGFNSSDIMNSINTPEQVPVNNANDVPVSNSAIRNTDAYGANGQGFAEPTVASETSGSSVHQSGDNAVSNINQNITNYQTVAEGMGAPHFNSDGTFGSRNVELSEGTMSMFNNMFHQKDEIMRNALGAMSRDTEARMTSRILNDNDRNARDIERSAATHADNLSNAMNTRFNDLKDSLRRDMEASGTMNTNEIESEINGLMEALKSAMDRKDELNEELNDMKMTSMTDQGNSGKVNPNQQDPNKGRRRGFFGI